jgi:hypothetical protein
MVTRRLLGMWVSLWQGRGRESTAQTSGTGMGLWVVEVASTAPTSLVGVYVYVIPVRHSGGGHHLNASLAVEVCSGRESVSGWLAGACQRRARLLLHAFKRELSILPNRITHGKNNDVHSVHTWWL